MAKNQNTTKVTRITASDDAQTSKKPGTKTSVAKKTTTTPKKVTKNTKGEAPKSTHSWGILGKLGGYFKGAWVELRQVHWPTRKATWGLTGAVLLFSGFFVAFIMLLDAGFKFLFEQILK